MRRASGARSIDSWPGQHAKVIRAPGPRFPFPFANTCVLILWSRTRVDLIGRVNVRACWLVTRQKKMGLSALKAFKDSRGHHHHMTSEGERETRKTERGQN